MRISDWSSDVCSSDLRFAVPDSVARAAFPQQALLHLLGRREWQGVHEFHVARDHEARRARDQPADEVLGAERLSGSQFDDDLDLQIGRASCRERACKYV